MSHELIHPNWHVILVHYPLALLTVGLFIEIFSFLYRRGTLRTAGRWMLLLGALSCIPTLTSGLYAYYDTVRYAGEGEAEMEPAGHAWYQLARNAQTNLSKQQWDDLKHHIWRVAPATVMLIIALVVYIGASDRWRRRLYFPLLLLAIFAVAVLIWGAWYSGESIHVRATAVERDATPWVLDKENVKTTVQGAIPPLQLHVLAAGLTVALALMALALSIRALSTRDALKAPQPMADSHDVVYSDSPSVQVNMTVIAEPVYPARFWLLAALFAAGTAAAGIWVAGWSLSQFQPLLAQPRDLAHIIAGGSILILALVLALVTRFARNRRWLVTLFSILLVLTIAAQVGLGILLMFDGSDKTASLFHFRQPPVQSATQPVANR